MPVILILVLEQQLLPNGFIALAKLKIDGKTVTIDESDKNVREYSGLLLLSPDKINALTLRCGGDGASNLAVLSGSLSVTGNVGIGTTSPNAKLEISGGNLKVSGNIYAANVASCAEILQMVRGTVESNGSGLAGIGFRGFNVTRNATGLYTITFDTAF